MDTVCSFEILDAFCITTGCQNTKEKNFYMVCHDNLKSYYKECW